MPDWNALRHRTMRGTIRARTRFTLAVLLAALPGAVRAQAQDRTTTCDGLVVQSVDVETQRPVFRGAMIWWRGIARALGLHHETTNEGLVRRFVTLETGQNCTDFRRSESERILRKQPYLSNATVSTTRMGDSVRVNVSTVDEVPLIAGARLRGATLEALNLGTMNFLGAGMRVEGLWERGGPYRDGVGARLAHYQLFGRPYSIVLEGARHPIGEVYGTALSHPFLTDLQRIAWHVGYFTSKDFAHLVRPDRTELLQPVDRTIWNAGGVVRVGPPRRLFLIGAMLLGERLVASDQVSLIDSTTGVLLPNSDTTGLRRYAPFDVPSFAGVLGLRTLTFTRMRGLDALAAEQDVGTGTQIGTVFGSRVMSIAPMRDGFASVDAYAGARTSRMYTAARAQVASRLDERHDWRHMIASGRAAVYFLATPRWTSELSVEAAAGWRTIFPFQIELGDREGGVRGYARSLEPGAQRVVLRLEQRIDLGRYQATSAAFGAAVFSDAGRMWAGDVPFGVTTPVRVSAGAALLAAVPAHSQRTMRAEVAIPFTQLQGARPELRFVVREPMHGFWFEPARIRWARLSTVPEQIFSWP